MRTSRVTFAVCLFAVRALAQEPIDLFSDEPKLGEAFIRVACWNLQHFDLNNGAREFLPGTNDEEDFDLLVKTYARAVDDLGLDCVALVEHQRLPGDPDRLSILVNELNSGQNGPWRSDETRIEYDQPNNRFLNLQFALLWRSDKLEIDPDGDTLLKQLRQPPGAKRMRVPWLVPVKSTAGNLEFDLLVLHLKSGGASPQADEVDAITQFIDQRQSSVTPRHLIVVGDWNLRPDNSAQRGRLRSMMVPTNAGNLMRVLTIEEIRPTLDGWEELGRFRSDNAVADLVPFSHFNHRPQTRTIDTLLDHIAISRTMDEIFDHPIRVTLESGGTDVRPGILLARPVLPELDYLRLTDHIPVVLTLRTTNAEVVVETVSTTLRIVSATPNPVGDDVELEQVTLRNDSTDDVTLAEWKIGDATGSTWGLNADDGTVSAGSEHTVVRRGRNMYLNNRGPETIKLINPQGQTVDERTYNGAESGQVIRFD